MTNLAESSSCGGVGAVHTQDCPHFLPPYAANRQQLGCPALTLSGTRFSNRWQGALLGLAVLGGLLLLGAGPANAHDGAHAQGSRSARQAATDNAASGVKLLDLELVDQDGRSARFKSDVISNRIVVMNFIYTSCTTVCPVTSAIFGQVQRRLGEHAGRDVFLVSVSLDPVTDRPARLKAYAEKHKARPGWIWLSGEKTTVDKLLTAVGAYTPDYIDHPPMILVGDGRAGRWTRFYGFVSPDQIMASVDKLLAARKATISAAVRHQ